MCLNIRAHFDGRALIPDQPLDLPVNQPLSVEITQMAASGAPNGASQPTPQGIKDRLRKLEALDGLLAGPVIPLESLRRENLYDDRP